MSDEKTKKSNKVYVTLPTGMRKIFDKLVESKIYGEGASEVGRYLIISRLDDLIKDGRFKPE
jgi:hypothetical protein